MNQEIAKEWIKALRSGEYEQGRKVLCRLNNGPSEFCCLGVLCEVARRSGLEIGIKEIKNNEGYVLAYDLEWSFLPESVQNFVGMQSKTGMVTLEAYGGLTSLAGLNDSKKLSFEEIANVIEHNWEGL
jgi:hypothetical protein